MLEVHPIEATDKELSARTCKEFLPESAACVEGLFGVAGTPLVAGRLPADVGVQKLEGLGSPECTGVRGAKDVRRLVLFCCSYPYNSFSASIANWNNWLVVLIFVSQQCPEFFASNQNRTDKWNPRFPPLCYNASGLFEAHHSSPTQIYLHVLSASISYAGL
jgi:hypothetical protein